jgi:hypothetical protein
MFRESLGHKLSSMSPVTTQLVSLYVVEKNIVGSEKCWEIDSQVRLWRIDS